MAKKKIIRIEASDIKTFRHLSNINRIINEQYNGQMPIEIYRGFLKRISNPAIKDIFIQKFRFKTPEKKLDKSDKTQQSRAYANTKISSKKCSRMK